MGLRDKLQRDAPREADPRKWLFERFGILENPFPSAGQPTGHPRLDYTEGDKEVVESIRQFERDYATQVLVVEGTQGIGKTNLLNYYQQELQDLYREDNTFYIIRYYPDPEPTFDAIVRRVFQELNQNHLIKIATKLKELNDAQAEQVRELARSYEIRIVLQKLRQAEDAATLAKVADTAMEWLVGLRLLNKHRDLLGVQFRLDTVESKTQALRDIVFISEKLELLKGIFLLLDELEKQDYSLTKTPVLRYLSAIRALIDALPRRLFLMLAITSEARRRYFEMLPAIASRLENKIILNPIRQFEEAENLASFYEANAKAKAQQDSVSKDWAAGREPVLTRAEISRIFETAIRGSADQGVKGVTHRAYLNRLRQAAEEKMAEAR
ncbi:hypothetical protein [Planctomyces sp. SH-PL62]|uniref:hypothetical protein n=1 Tax=Planctomyces sp. SH-PL62 TaxID=1636152 RepID=UPI00078E90F9|nr:hypothetical protein [Planctomyces sp. SH-PL62]AMV40506.1 hypothetical protein VT85_23955 [Planctomyces sp. SH-PL62]